MSDLQDILTALQMPDKSLLFCGPDPAWSPDREDDIQRDERGLLVRDEHGRPIVGGKAQKGKRKRRLPPIGPQTENGHCPLCRVVMTLPIGAHVQRLVLQDGEEVWRAETLKRATPVRHEPPPKFLCLPMPPSILGSVMLDDGRVFRPAEIGDLLMDSELLIHVCAKCRRVRSEYSDKLRGTTHVENHKRLSHRAGRIKGKPEPSINPYLTATERQDAAKAKAARKMKGKRKAG